MGKQRLKVINGDHTQKRRFRCPFTRYLSNTLAPLQACLLSVLHNTANVTAPCPIHASYSGPHSLSWGHHTEVPAAQLRPGPWGMTQFILWLEGHRHEHAGAPTPPTLLQISRSITSAAPGTQESGRTGQGPSSIAWWTTDTPCVGDLPMTTQEPWGGGQDSASTLCSPALPWQSTHGSCINIH